jgi:hypothetical protein
VIYKLKRENLEVRRAVDPLRPVAAELVDHHYLEMPDDLRPYFHDLGEHLLRVSDLSGQYDVLLGTVLEAARSRQAVQQNDDMRKISAWVAILAVPTMIAGIYGMNFDFMPELRASSAAAVLHADGHAGCCTAGSSAAAGSSPADPPTSGRGPHAAVDQPEDRHADDDPVDGEDEHGVARQPAQQPRDRGVADHERDDRGDDGGTPLRPACLAELARLEHP